MKKVKKIAIVGNAGSGKSTLARTLHQILNLPLYHLDKYCFKQDWIRTELNEYKLIHDKICEKDKWIIDGNNLQVSENRFKNADTIIFLDVPTYKCLWRIIKRVFKYYGQVAPASADKCVESFFNFRFLIFLKWVLRFRKNNFNKIMKILERYKNDKKIFIIKCQNDIEDLIKNLQ